LNDAAGIVDHLRDGLLPAEAQQNMVQRLADDPTLREAVIDEWHFQRRLSCLMAPGDTAALWQGIEYGLRFDRRSSGAQRSLVAVQRRVSARRPRSQVRRRIRWPLMAASVAAAAMLVAVLLVGRDGEAPPALQVTTMQGEVQVRRADAVFPAHPTMALQVNDHIETLAGSSVSLVLSDGSRIQLAAATIMEWSGNARFYLNHGAIDVTAKPRSATDAMIIATPRAQTTVVGTRFRLHHLDDQTALTVAEGSVRFATDGAVRLVHAGDQATSPSSARQALRDPVTDRDDLPRVVGFRFVDADSGASLPGLELVTTDVIIDTTTMPAHGWTVIAITKPERIPAILFSIDDVAVRTLQLLSPYALTNTQDRKNGDRYFEPWNPKPGTYHLKAVISRSTKELHPVGTPLGITLTIKSGR